MDDRVLEAFTFGSIQECLNIKLKLDEFGISWEEFIEWVRDKSKRHMPVQKKTIPEPYRKVLKRRCPECKSWLHLYEVNTHPANMVGEAFTCQWYCSACGWEKYSRQDIVDEAKPYVEDLTIVYVAVTAADRKKQRRLEAGKTGGCGGN